MPVYSCDVNQDLMRTTHVLKKSNRNKSQSEKPPLSPLGVSTHRETPNCTGESVCILKCKYTVLEFFGFFCFFLWPEVSFQSSSSFVQRFFFYFFILLIVFFLCFLALGTGLFTFLWAWSMFDLHFLILGHQVVSIMCEKCLLYSFKKFQAEYKSIYKYLSTYSGGVLSVCWVAPSDSFSFCRRTLEEGFFFCFCQWKNHRCNSLSRCKSSDCTSLLLFCFTFEY